MTDIIISGDILFAIIGLTAATITFFIRQEIRSRDQASDIKEVKGCIKRIESRLGVTDQKVADIDKDVAIIDDRYRREHS